MRYSFAAAALAVATVTTGVNGAAMPQTSSSSSGCQISFEGSFQIKVVTGSTPATGSTLATPRMNRRAQCGSDRTLVATLKDGTLTDAQGRIGSIVSNHQFQFDPAPGQVNALATTGFSICNNKLALKGSTNFFQCRSGDFFNLYDESIAPQCQPITIDILSCDSGSSGSGSSGSGGSGEQMGNGHQIGDGQVQSPASQQGGGPANEAGEGQLQNPGAGGSGTQPGGSSGVGSGTQPGGSSGGGSGTQPGAGGGSGGGGSPSGGGSSGGTPTCASCSGGSQPSGSGAGGGGGTSGGQQPSGNGAGGGASGGQQPSGTGPAAQLGDGQVQSGGQGGGGGGGAANEAGEGQIQSPARF